MTTTPNPADAVPPMLEQMAALVDAYGLACRDYGYARETGKRYEALLCRDIARTALNAALSRSPAVAPGVPAGVVRDYLAADDARLDAIASGAFGNVLRLIRLDAVRARAALDAALSPDVQADAVKRNPMDAPEPMKRHLTCGHKDCRRVTVDPETNDGSGICLHFDNCLWGEFGCPAQAAAGQAPTPAVGVEPISAGAALPEVETIAEACKPWEFHTGNPPDYYSPLSGVFGAGMAYTERLLAGLVNVTSYEGGDGSEDFDRDATKTLENILTAAGLYDPEEDQWASLAAAGTGDAGRAIPRRGGDHPGTGLVTSAMLNAAMDEAGSGWFPHAGSFEDRRWLMGQALAAALYTKIAPAPAAAQPPVAGVDLREVLERIVQEFEGTIAQYDKLGPDWTGSDGTEKFNASAILDRRDLIEAGRAALDAPSSDRGWATDEWRPIATAPYLREVEVRAGTMHFRAKLMPGVSMDYEGAPCDQWQATREGEHPPSWSGGACWESNEDLSPSLHPDAWRSLPTPPTTTGAGL